MTVGHSTRTAEQLVELLREAGVRLLVDVRRYPGSRRHPQFSRDALATTLAESGIAYRHEPRLGGRRTARPGSPNTAWRSESFRAYADHIVSDEFQDALASIQRDAADRTVALMCAEAVPWRCHRQLIADVLVSRDVAVEHLIGPGQRRAHELNPAARVDAVGRVSYPAPAEPQRELFDETDR